ncbi:hypothetical protein [Desulfonema ishimotonii]|uniref:hypothetical protein n=1 Tax=Desulfonema ishimotonii TaxID=45657 RepID=UPI000F58B45C|nr:hypothetical protein [Desulfonema ishimotonii]
MKNIFYKWITNESWGFLRFLADGFVGLLFIPARFLVIFWWFSIGCFIAKALNGFIGINFLIGSIWAFLFILLLLWAISLGRLLIFFPFPSCRQKKCNNINDYTWTMGQIYGREKWGVHRYWCRCGDEYVRQGKRFMRILPDGTKQPYMILGSFRNWQTDDGAGIEKSGSDSDK